jgi:tetratricopeptide (TPR) repeat protein
MSTSIDQEGLSIRAAVRRAYAHWNAGQAEQAEQYCRRVLDAWPGHADVLHLLGLMAHADGKLDLAIAHLSEACKATHTPAIYSCNLAEMYRQKGLLAEGEAAARRAVAMDALLAPGWNNLGIVLQEAGKFDESRACFERLIALKPDWPDAHNNLANTWRCLGRFDTAEHHYRRALALNPDYVDAHSNLAFLLSSQGRHDEAAQAAQRAIELDPRLADAYVSLAGVEASRHRVEAALRALQMLRAFAPRNPAGLVAGAKALRRPEL